jgi:hypothetical protein
MPTSPRRRRAHLPILACALSGALLACQPDDGADGTLDQWPPANGYVDAAYPVVLADGAVVPGYVNDAGIVVPAPGLDAGAVAGGDGGGLVLDGAITSGDGGAADEDASTDVPDAAVEDSGAGGGMDAGKPDAGAPDAGKPDAGAPDAGKPDAGTPDAGKPDAGTPDAGAPDAGGGSISSCTVTATTAAQRSGIQYDMYGCALWIQDSAGKLVRRFALYYTSGKSYTRLNSYNTAVSGVSPLDGVTGASITGARTHNFTWNVKNGAGAVVPDGSYKLVIENHGNAGDRTLSVPFTKAGASAVNATVADAQGVSGARITCK